MMGWDQQDNSTNPNKDKHKGRLKNWKWSKHEMRKGDKDAAGSVESKVLNSSHGNRCGHVMILVDIAQNCGQLHLIQPQLRLCCSFSNIKKTILLWPDRGRRPLFKTPAEGSLRTQINGINRMQMIQIKRKISKLAGCRGLFSSFLPISSICTLFC